MKKALIFLIGFLFLISACVIKPSDDSDDSYSGTAPRITNVQLFYWDGYDWVEDDLFYIGEYTNFLAYVTDPDLNITTLWISQFYPYTSDTPYYGPDAIMLPSQSAADASYYSIEPFEVEGPAGNWRIEFQAEDDTNKMSNVFTKYFIIYQ